MRPRRTPRTIVINATHIGRKLDGIGVYALNLLRTLSEIESGFRFIIYLTRNAKEHIENISFPLNFRIVWAPTRISPDYGPAGHFLRLLHAAYIGARHKSDIFFTPSQMEAALFRPGQIIAVHDIIPLLFKKLHKKQYLYFKLALGRSLQSAKAIIAPSAHTKDLLVKAYNLPPGKIHIIHIGFSEVFKQGKGQESSGKEKYILYCGRISRMKNVERLINAFRLIQEKLDHVLVIAGSGRRPSNVGTDEKIIFKGFTSEKDLAALYRRASLFVFPSLYEGFGLPPLEAMASGCPVVVSNVSSLPEVCGDAAFYVNPRSTESIAGGILKVIANDSLRKEMIEKGLRRASLFSWEKTARELLQVFASSG